MRDIVEYIPGAMLTDKQKISLLLEFAKILRDNAPREVYEEFSFEAWGRTRARECPKCGAALPHVHTCLNAECPNP